MLVLELSSSVVLGDGVEGRAGRGGGREGRGDGRGVGLGVAINCAAARSDVGRDVEAACCHGHGLGLGCSQAQHQACAGSSTD